MCTMQKESDPSLCCQIECLWLWDIDISKLNEIARFDRFSDLFINNKHKLWSS